MKGACIRQYPHNQSKQEHYLSASKWWRSSLQRGFYEETIADLQLFIQHYQSDRAQFYGIGNCEEKEGICLASQIEWFYNSIETNKQMDNPYDLLSLLVSCLKAKQTEIGWYLKMLNLRPSCYKLHYGLANAYYNANRYSLAEKHYEKAVKINPSFAKGYIGLAWIQIYHYRRSRKAYTYAKYASSIDNKEFFARLIAGQYHSSQLQGLNILEDLSQEYKSNSAVLCAKGYQLLKDQDEYQNAEIAFYEAVNISKFFILPCIYLAQHHLDNKKGKFETIQQYLKAGISMRPQKFIMYSKLGQLYFEAQRCQEAFCYFKKLLKINQEDYSSFFYLGQLYYQYFKPSNIKSAIKSLKTCIQIDPYRKRGYSKLRQIYSNEEQFELLKQLNKVQLGYILQQPDSNIPKLQSFLRKLLERCNFDTEIQEIVFKGVKDHQSSMDLSIFFAQFYFKKRLMDYGVKYLNRCLEIDPLNEQLLMLINAIHQAGLNKDIIEQYFSQHLTKINSPILSRNSCLSIVKILKLFPTEQNIKVSENMIAANNNLQLLLFLAGNYKKIGKHEESLKIYERVQESKLLLDFSTQQEKNSFFGKNLRKWREKNALGVHPLIRQIQLSKNQLYFRQKFQLLFSTKK